MCDHLKRVTKTTINDHQAQMKQIIFWYLAVHLFYWVEGAEAGRVGRNADAVQTAFEEEPSGPMPYLIISFAMNLTIQKDSIPICKSIINCERTSVFLTNISVLYVTSTQEPERLDFTINHWFQKVFQLTLGQILYRNKAANLEKYFIPNCKSIFNSIATDVFLMNISIPYIMSTSKFIKYSIPICKSIVNCEATGVF